MDTQSNPHGHTEWLFEGSSTVRFDYIGSTTLVLHDLAMEPLPPTFKALYRLVLRATSASVLHQPTARRNLFKLWRPTFDGAAQVIHDLHSHELNPVDRLRHAELLDTLQRRMDNTLTFLLSSAQSRGVAHKVIRNVGMLCGSHRTWIQLAHYNVRRWQPQLPPSAPEYTPQFLVPKDRRSLRARAKKNEAKQTDERCWHALGELIRMAEGRHGLCLGRIRLKPWTIERD